MRPATRLLSTEVQSHLVCPTPQIRSGLRSQHRNQPQLPSSASGCWISAIPPDILRFTTAEINEAKLQPIDIPKLSLPDLGTSINIDKFGSTEIPLDVESTNGGSDINLPILDWHPRWRQEVCIKVWRYKKCVYVEFGVNLNISLYYRWSMTLLKFKMAIRNAFVNGVTVTVKASSILLRDF